MTKNKKFLVTMIVFIVLFYAAWTAYTLLLWDPLKLAVGHEIPAALLSDGVIKNLLWTLPALLLIGCFRDEMAVSLPEMLRLKGKNALYLLLAIPLVLFVIGPKIIRGEGLSLSPSFTPALIVTSVFVGFSEESVFRGLLLNASLKNAASPVRCGIAYGINALMFLLIHFPTWIHTGTLGTIFTGTGFLTILLLSVLFSFCFHKTRCLWVPALLHSLYDLTVFLFV